MLNITTEQVSRECRDPYFYVALCLAGIAAAITAKANREPEADVPEFQLRRFSLQTDGKQSLWESVDGGLVNADTHVIGMTLVQRQHDEKKKPRLLFVVLFVDLIEQASVVSDITYTVTPEGDEWPDNFDEMALRAVLKQLPR